MKSKQIIDSVTFFNGDSFKYISNLPDNSFDLAIIDPPYGGDDATNIKSTKGLGTNHYAKRTDYEQFENVAPAPVFFEELKRVSKEQIIFGWNFFAERTNMNGGIIVWNKFGTAFGEAEIALATMIKSVRIYNLRWNGFLKHQGAEELRRWHSTAKPRRLYEYLLLNYAKPGFKVLDTHGGSMSIARAVYDVNLKESMRIELTVLESNTTFYDKAIQDYKTHTQQKSLFDEF